MRVLSNEELDEVFGGTDQVTVTNLSGYTVNATVYSWSNPGGSPGFSSGGVTGESGTAPCMANYYRALANIPSFAHIRCLAAKVNHPSMKLNVSVDMNLLNEFTYISRAANGAADLSKVYVTNVGSTPTGYDNIMYGLTNHGNPSQGVPDKLTLTAGALTPKSADYSLPYTDVNGTTGQVMHGPWTGEEFAVIITAHEAAHTHGIGTSPADEAVAWGYGYYALQQYRALPADQRCVGN